MRITIQIDTDNATWEDDQELRRVMHQAEMLIRDGQSTPVVAYHSCRLSQGYPIPLWDTNGNRTGEVTMK